MKVISNKVHSSSSADIFQDNLISKLQLMSMMFLAYGGHMPVQFALIIQRTVGVCRNFNKKSLCFCVRVSLSNLGIHLLSCRLARLLLRVTCPRVHTGFFDDIFSHFDIFSVLFNLAPHWVPIVGHVAGSAQGKAKK